ncbi:MAG: SDR family oxidoreductase, partial [Cytophagales bacterium]|nr:SDR family oxidoreductase [Cytophagales bacterium]
MISGKHILITGSKGYLGSALLCYLQERGKIVLGIDRPDDFRKLSVSDLEDIDVVIHLAAYPRIEPGLNEETLYQVNVDSTRQLAEKAITAGVKQFIFTSSCMLYMGASPIWKDERHENLNLDNPYARSKFQAEKTLQTLTEGSMKIIVLRLASVFGYSPNMRYDFGLNNLMAQASVGDKIQIRSHKTVTISYVE